MIQLNQILKQTERRMRMSGVGIVVEDVDGDNEKKQPLGNQRLFF